MKNYWIHGGIGALVSFMLILIFNYFVTDNETFMYLAFSGLSLSLLFSVFSIVHKIHKERTGDIAISEYFKNGMKVNMIYVLLTVIFLYLFFKVIAPTYLSDRIEAHIAMAKEYYQANVSGNEKLQAQTYNDFIADVREQANSMFSAKITLPFIAILCLFLGTVYSLFLGVYYKLLLKNF